MVELSTIFAIIIPIMLIYIGIVFVLYNNDPNKHPLDTTLARLISGIIGGILCSSFIIKYHNYSINIREMMIGIIISGIIAYITYISVNFFTQLTILKTIDVPPFQTIINAITVTALGLMFYNFNSWDDKLEFLYIVLFILGSGYILFSLTNDMNVLEKTNVAIYESTDRRVNLYDLYDWFTQHIIADNQIKPILFVGIILLWKYLKTENNMANVLITICLFLLMFFNFISITADVVSIDN